MTMTDLAVVGAGPVGMALAYRNVDFLFVEAGDYSLFHTRVGSVGPRSMKLFRRWGIADEGRSSGWPGDNLLDGAWVTSVGGHEILRVWVGTANTPLQPVLRAGLPAALVGPAAAAHGGRAPNRAPGRLHAAAGPGALQRHRSRYWRERLQRSDLRREFESAWVHFGFRYTSSIIVVDSAPGPESGPRDWQQSSAPGCRGPHASLYENRSTRELFDKGFRLLVFTDFDRRAALVERAFGERGVPIDVTVWREASVAELCERRFVVVLPDGHVAWRVDELQPDRGQLADTVRGADTDGSTGGKP